MNESLSLTLRKLRLSGLSETLDVRLQEAGGNHLTHAEFLELILEDELLVRKERQIARRVKSAAFRELKSLEEFDWSFNSGIKKSEVYDLATGRFIEQRRDVLFCSSWNWQEPHRPGGRLPVDQARLPRSLPKHL